MKVHSSGFALARTEGRPCDDAWCLRERGATLAAALADGVGSSREGGTAAQRAVTMLVDCCLSRPLAWSPRRALAEITAQINRQLHAESMERHGQAELTCTLCAVLIEEGRLYGCNVGDSSVLRWRQGRLQRLSEAHVVDDPGLSHVLTRALGLAATVEPHAFETDVQAGDVIVLCSDGVSQPLPDDRLEELLSRQASARTLVASARSATTERREIPDDASAIVIEVEEATAGAASARARLEVVPRLAAGMLLHGFHLERPLDPLDRVWQARAADGHRVVLKFPPLDAADVEAVRDAFIREAWNACRLTSPDLVRAWMPDGDIIRCYVMEHVDAPTLREALRPAAFPVEEACQLAAFLLRTTQFLLRHDLAHGDLKPENILVLRSADGVRFKLLDLGSAAELFSVTQRSGTATYLAPERFHGAPLSERTEIFAIGVTLYEALARTFPYGEVERFQTPRFELTPRPLSTRNAAVPAWLDSIVRRALDPDPERRFQHFSEMLYALEHPAAVPPHHRKDAPLLERNPLLFYQVLCAALGLLCAVLLYALARR